MCVDVCDAIVQFGVFVVFSRIATVIYFRHIKLHKCSLQLL